MASVSYQAMLFMLFVVVFWMVFVGAIVEVVLAFRWNRRLYRQGFVIFRREYPLADVADARLDLSTLQKEFRGLILPHWCSGNSPLVSTGFARVSV